ncbi:ARM repeat superfamily protein [Actinidia rufa]|uniref:ARM repeat superfamily protein n=1 Tax=Actinidia rufa TaxID=165716 RepID=A0A7J0DDG3_9ERIC|nr:ARM repeat superfamily protein [Actinidia rufa]
MALTIPTHFKFKPLNLQHQKPQTHLEFIRVRSTRNCSIGSYFSTHHRIVLTRVCSDGGRETRVGPQQPVPYDLESSRSGSSSPADGDVAFFVRMLGLDNDPLEREKAVIALWKYSQRGEQYVDAIMQFHESINLTVNLLQSDSSSACEAALGLLRMISSVNVYREFVAESGAIEVIIALLSRSFLTSGVKEQSLYTLWNLSIDEKLQEKIANPVLLPLLINFLEDGNKKVKECAGGFLATLARSRFNHKVMVEAGVIPKMAKLLKTDVERSNVSANFLNIDVDRLKVIRKEMRNTLLELAKDECYRILVMEEGLLLVPLVGTTAYKSFRPPLDSRPSWPDGTLIEWTPKVQSKYGASEVLLGLRCRDNDANMEEAKINAMAAQSRQRFLARAGCIEMENGENSQGESSSDLQFTILPLLDGVARLVLILGLEDESAIARAAESIAGASTSNHMRVSFKEAGAVKHLVRLLGHRSDAVRLAVIHALERLSVSNGVCRIIEVEGVLHPLIDAMKNSEALTA